MNKDILIVDDEENILTLMGHTFTDLGWEPYVATNATDALELFKRVQPPLVLTDLRLGDGIGGVNICKEIKNIAPLTVIVAMSGYYDEFYSISHLRRSGFDHMLPKPLNHDKCKLLVKTVTICRTGWDELMG